MPAPTARIRVGIDVGGTFTDAALRRRRPDRRRQGANDTGRPLGGLRRRAAGARIPSGSRRRPSNTSRTGRRSRRTRSSRGSVARVGLLTNRGFRDVLAIGTQMRRHVYDLWTPEPAPLVARDLCLEIGERLAADGRSAGAARATTTSGTPPGVSAREASRPWPSASSTPTPILPTSARPGGLLGELLPGIPITLSCDVAPEYREYVRASTTALNAGLPLVGRTWTSSAAEQAGRRGPGAGAPDAVERRRLAAPSRQRDCRWRSLASGPAAAVVGSRGSRRRSRRPDVLTFDMGGTTRDVARGRRRAGQLRYRGEAAGHPINLPQIDVLSVGAGGGSIARVDAFGVAARRPRERGRRARPGRVRRGRRATRRSPTPTSCSARSTRTARSAGASTLDAAPARRAVERHVARPLGLGVEEAAARDRSASPTRTWSGHFVSSPSPAATTRAGSRSSPSAAPGRCTPARSPTSSASARSSSRRFPGVAPRSGCCSPTCATTCGGAWVRDHGRLRPAELRPRGGGARARSVASCSPGRYEGGRIELLGRSALPRPGVQADGPARARPVTGGVDRRTERRSRSSTSRPTTTRPAGHRDARS